MQTVGERVAYVEGQVNEHSHTFVEIHESVRHLEQRMDTRFDGLDQKMSRQFLWLVGIQVTALLTFVSALLTR